MEQGAFHLGRRLMHDSGACQGLDDSLEYLQRFYEHTEQPCILIDKTTLQFPRLCRTSWCVEARSVQSKRLVVNHTTQSLATSRPAIHRNPPPLHSPARPGPPPQTRDRCCPSVDAKNDAHTWHHLCSPNHLRNSVPVILLARHVVGKSRES